MPDFGLSNRRHAKKIACCGNGFAHITSCQTSATANSPHVHWYVGIIISVSLLHNFGHIHSGERASNRRAIAVRKNLMANTGVSSALQGPHQQDAARLSSTGGARSSAQSHLSQPGRDNPALSLPSTRAAPAPLSKAPSTSDAANLSAQASRPPTSSAPAQSSGTATSHTQAPSGSSQDPAPAKQAQPPQRSE